MVGIRRFFILGTIIFTMHARPMYLENELYEPKEMQKKQLLSIQRTHTMVDIAALFYVIYHIALLYNQSNNTNPQDLNWFTKCVKAICPTSIANLSAHALFVTRAFGIAIETLVYKTLARLIVLCAHGDIFNLLQKKIIDDYSIAQNDYMGSQTHWFDSL